MYGRQGVAEYWIVDPDGEAVEVWNFAASTAERRVVTDRLEVRVGGSIVGQIDLVRIFAKPG